MSGLFGASERAVAGVEAEGADVTSFDTGSVADGEAAAFGAVVIVADSGTFGGAILEDSGTGGVFEGVDRTVWRFDLFGGIAGVLPVVRRAAADAVDSSWD